MRVFTADLYQLLTHLYLLLQGSSIVIIAGYEHQMKAMMHINPGFTGRFGSTLHFQDWTAEELSSLVMSQLAKGPPPDHPFSLEDSASMKTSLVIAFEKLQQHNPEAFCNARDAIQMITRIKSEYASRCCSLPKTPFPSVSGMVPYTLFRCGFFC